MPPGAQPASCQPAAPRPGRLLCACAAARAQQLPAAGPWRRRPAGRLHGGRHSSCELRLGWPGLSARSSAGGPQAGGLQGCKRLWQAQPCHLTPHRAKRGRARSRLASEAALGAGGDHLPVFLGCSLLERHVHAKLRLQLCSLPEEVLIQVAIRQLLCHALALLRPLGSAAATQGPAPKVCELGGMDGHVCQPACRLVGLCGRTFQLALAKHLGARQGCCQAAHGMSWPLVRLLQGAAAAGGGQAIGVQGHQLEEVGLRPADICRRGRGSGLSGFARRAAFLLLSHRALMHPGSCLRRKRLQPEQFSLLPASMVVPLNPPPPHPTTAGSQGLKPQERGCCIIGNNLVVGIGQVQQ